MSSLHMAAAAHDDAPAASSDAPEDPPEQSSAHLVARPLDDPDHAAPASFASVNSALSHPQTAATSSAASSVVPDNADLPPSTSGTPVPAALTYGTRSRNRGAPRPNYAEDHDVDAELDATSKNNPSRRVSSLNQASNHSNGTPGSEPDGTAGVTTRRTQAAVNGNATSSAAGKDAIPGTSTFSANPNAGGNVSKKRKQPGSNQTVQGSTTPNGEAVPGNNFVASASPVAPSVSNMMTFNNSQAILENGKLRADDGTVLSTDDHVYLICEPPGEPYYLARIMEFLPSKSNAGEPVENLRVNWFYRPRDIQRKAADMRVIFASMHSDTCPLTSLRGKCRIRHRTEIENLEEYKKTKDSFWFEKMYDRYIQRYYEVVPTAKVINVPEHVKRVLDERWKFVLVEMGRRAELTSQVKTCKRCSRYSATSDSVDCAVCKNTWHMHCVRPVLLKKPARGFAWACAACSRAQEKQMEARNTPIIGEAPPEPEPELPEEEEEDPAAIAEATQRSSPSNNSEQIRPATSEQIAHAKLWPFRYLGIHCRVEDALDYDDRIYPRASSRLGTRHQANVGPWFGHPIRYVKPPDKKKQPKGGKTAAAAIETEKAEKANRPKWILDEPAGYVRRGEDDSVPVSNKQIHTAQPQFKMPDASQLPARGEDEVPGSSLGEAEREKFVDDYMKDAKKIATSKGIQQYSTNFLDKALKLLYDENFSAESALARLKQVNKYKDLKEPHLRPDEVKLFESGVAKYGSELRNVTKHVGTVPHRHIVRYYYMWKKTPQGRRIWGNFEGRKSKQAAKKADSAAKLVDDVADDHDDSAFDNDKAATRKRRFTCKFCSARSSRQWRRAPGAASGSAQSGELSSKREKGLTLTVALCQRCAVLWRKYGIHWEDADEVAKRIVQVGNKSWRRRYEEQLLAQLLTSSESDVKINSTTASTALSLALPVTAEMTRDEPFKKKSKPTDKETNGAGRSHTPSEPGPKKKVAEKPSEPPPLNPEPPRVKVLPCAICKKMEPTGDQHLACRDCRLTVHRACYGVSNSQNSAKWFCDMCSNDKNPVISTSYECVLCPVTWTEHELMEPPKMSHKKKSEREREKEKREKDMVLEAMKLYRQRQEDQGKPVGPQEGLKRTDGNNWVHVTCAVWIPEVKFGNSKELEPAESLAMIPPERFKDSCKICKTGRGACVPCHNPTCNARFHVGCADQAGYTLGFDVTPVKSSRRDAVHTIKLGEEVGAVTPAIWCPHHTVSIVHEISEPTEVDGLNTLQLYVQTYKQADLTLTGTVRKAAHVQQSVGTSTPGGMTAASRRRLSSFAGSQKENPQTAGKGTTAPPKEEADVQPGPTQLDGQWFPEVSEQKQCHRCQTTFSPKWWVCEPLRQRPSPMQTNDMVGGEGQIPGASSVRPLYECHRCHSKKPEHTPPPPADIRPSPFAGNRDASVAVSRGSEYPRPPPAPVPYTHPIQPPGGPPVAPPHVRPPPSHVAAEWQSDYDQRPGSLSTHPLPNGPPAAPGPNGMPLGPPNYHSAPAPPPHMNGFQTTLPPHHNGGPPHPGPYDNAPPSLRPPQSYPTHQSPYRPVSIPSSGPPPIPATNQPPYSSSSSPPAAHFSPPASLGTLPPPARTYSAERAFGPNLPSPSISRPSVDSQPPTSAKAASAEGTKPENSGRNNAQPTGSGASASPSLKNLLL